MPSALWTPATPSVRSGDVPTSYLPVRVQGPAGDGTDDRFAQVPLVTILTAAAATLTDINGGEPPSGPGLYLDGGVLKYKAS